MPIGYDCEYPDFEACVRDNQDKDNPEGWCAALAEETEERCAGQSAALVAAASVDVRGPTIAEIARTADRFERLVRREMQAAADLAAKRVRRAGSVARLSVKDLNVIFGTWETAVRETLLPAVEQAWLDAANPQLERVRAALPLLASVPMSGGDRPPTVPDPYAAGTAAAADYMSTATNRLDGIGNDLWGAARDSLTTGMAEGQGIRDLAKGVSGATGVAMPRATMIARTEMTMASNAGSIFAMRGLGGIVATKTWVATGDGRTRDTHTAAWGQTRNLNEMFFVGSAQLDRPGDAWGPPAEIVHCRCTMTYGLSKPPTALAGLVAAPPGLTDTSGMIALRPADPEALTVDGGDPPEDLHVTMVFLGDEVTDEAHQAAAEAAQRVAGDIPGPFTARVAGYGVLGGEDACVVFLNGDGFAAVRDALDAAELAAPEQWAPWICHMTIGYGVDLSAAEGMLGREFEIDALSVDVGDTHERFVLGGDPATVSAAG